MTWNLGSAILIVGSGYLYFQYHLELWIALAAIALAVATWGYLTGSDDREKLRKLQVRYWEAKVKLKEAEVKRLA